MAAKAIKEFLSKFGEATFNNHELLVPSLTSEAEVSGSHMPVQPCSEYSHVYRVRAGMHGREGGPDSDRLQKDFITLADALDQTPDIPCRLWMFRDPSRRFFVFENADTDTIIDCVWWHGDSA